MRDFPGDAVDHLTYVQPSVEESVLRRCILF